MFTLHKIKNLLKTLLYCFAVITICNTHNAYAGNGCGNEDNAYAHYVDPTVNQLYKAEIIGNEDATTLALKQRYPELLKEINKLLYAACEKSRYFDNFSEQSNQKKFLEELGTYDLYMQKVAELKNVADKLNALPTSNECGEKHPFGCPKGQKCYKSTSVSSGGFQSYTTNSYTTYQCSEKDPGGKWLGVQNTQVENSGGKGSEYVSAGALNLQMSQTDADGKTTNTNVGMSALGAEGKLATSHEYAPVTGEVEGDAYIQRTNDECDIPGLKDAYLSTCYSCRIVGQMLEVFLAAANQAFGVTSEAGIKLLTIGMFIWVAIYILKQISKFVQPEPMVMLQELFTFFFKCIVAYIAITSGLRVFTDLIINPILKTGADFGIAMVESVMPDLLKTDDEAPLAQDEPYSVEPIQNQQQASQVAQQNDVTIRGQVKLSQLRPENMSQLNESGMNYCQIGGDHDHAFGAHQLDYRYAAADFAKTCANPQFNKAYTASGYAECVKNKTPIETCGQKLRSQIKPIIEQLCKKPPQPQGQQQMKQLQQTYYEKNIYQKAFDAANKQFGLNPKLTLQNYTNPEYFVLSSALISAEVAGSGNRQRFLNAVGSCAQPCDFNKLGTQLYGQLQSWGEKMAPQYGDGFKTRYKNELDWCNKKLAYLGMGGVNDFDNATTPTNNYYVAKTKDNSTVLIAVPKAADGRELIDDTVMSRLMYLSKKVDNAVSINFVIGNAVTCHSTHAGAIQFAQEVTDLIGIKFFFPNVWLWICGIIIWVFAFMLVIGVNFYLLDIGFKIGIVLLLMPVALGLWPFASPFNKVFSALMKQIIHAAGIFAFLGVSTAMSISIISASIGNTDTLLQAIQNNNTEYVSETFGLWSGSFILIIFAYLYSHKLISETVDKMTNKFFDGDMTGNSIHTMTVQAMDWCKSKAMAAAGLVAGVITGGASSAAQMVGKAAVKTAVKTAASTARGVGRGVGAVARKFKRGNNN